MKCGVTLHQQDLNVIFKIFDKNNTGLIDYSNFGISSGKRGSDDQYTTGKITSNECKLPYRKNGIEIYSSTHKDSNDWIFFQMIDRHRLRMNIINVL